MQEKKVWCDVARICGLELPFIKYWMSEDRIFTKRGIISTQVEEVLLYRILDISMRISIAERFTKTGTIILHTNDASCKTLTLTGIKNPKKVRMLISEEVEKSRIRTGVRGKEMFGVTP